MSDDDKLIISADEAESLLADGTYIHNFVNPAVGMLIGCDYDRADAIKAFKSALRIEIGGDGCKSMKHPICVWESKDRNSFFEADMDKVEALEAARAAKSVAP